MNKPTPNQATNELLHNILTDYETRRDLNGLLPDGTRVDPGTMRENAEIPIYDYAIFQKYAKG
jgi:hypothetical protein